MANAASGLSREYENSPDALKVLDRLVNDLRMRKVWAELYKKTRSGAGEEPYYHPGWFFNSTLATRLRKKASESRAKGTDSDLLDAKIFEAEANNILRETQKLFDAKWSEQDLAVQSFFVRTFTHSLDIKPIFLSDLLDRKQAFSAAASSLRDHSSRLQFLQERYEAEKLDDLASWFESQAENLLADWATKNGERADRGDWAADDPWVIARDNGDPILKTLIVDLSIVTRSIFDKPLYGTLATIVNVVLDRHDVTDVRVREILRWDPGA